MTRMSRDEYMGRYGPTAGDQIPLGDTDLVIEVEADLVGPGYLARHAHGGTTRTGLLQADGKSSESHLDAVIMGVVVVDPLLGVVKADIGIKDGRIVGIGRAGDPDRIAGVDMTLGPGTSVIVNGHGAIATAGAIDSHIHEISPRIIPAALSGGTTTLITAGYAEPVTNMHHLLRSMDQFPVNFAAQPCGRSALGYTTNELIEGGAAGLKIHEDTGAFGDVIDASLTSAEAYDVAVCLHTDGFNESGFVEDTISAINGRTVHAYHVEGSGGGHTPDCMAVIAEPNIIASSTTPTIPMGPSSATEQLEMIIANHEKNPHVEEDVIEAGERISEIRMAAEGPLHELGAIQIINSDSNGMGRIGEVVRRTWQLCHVMKAHAGEQGTNDNDRVLRYLCKYTTEPAITHGIFEHVGTLAPGRIADIVLWDPRYFGVKPAAVIKGGYLAWGQFGEGNGSSPGIEPVRYGPWWGGLASTAPELSTTFVSQAALDADVKSRIGSKRRFEAVRGTRGLTTNDLFANKVSPPVEVSRTDGGVRLNGEQLAIDPVDNIPLSRRYLLA